MMDINPGDLFGKWTVVEKSESRVCHFKYRKTRNIRHYFKCVCICGNESLVRSDLLTNKKSKACRKCASRENALLRNIKYPQPYRDISGKRFGQLVAIKMVRAEKVFRKNGNRSTRYFWLFKCDCGREVIKRARRVLSSQGTRALCSKVYHPDGFTNGGSGGPEYSLWKALYTSYRTNAGYSKRVFGLTFDEAVCLFKASCKYCGRSPSKKKTHKVASSVSVKWNGIDRINSREGYFIKNCVTCCEDCNLAKSNSTVDDFLSWVKMVYLHSIKSKPSRQS